MYLSDHAQMLTTVFAVKNFKLGGHETLETAVISQSNLYNESIFVTEIRMLSLFGDMLILGGCCMANALSRLFFTILSAVAVKATRGTLGSNALS